MTALKWSKFYWSDWQSDPKLRLCGLAAQGLWMRMLCIISQSEPVGFLTINGNDIEANGSLPRMIGETPECIDELLDELEINGVFSRDRSGRIFSRRVLKDNKNRKKAVKNGKMGGNPTLSKQKEKPPGDNPPLKGRLKTQRLEARGQRLEARKKEKNITDIPIPSRKSVSDNGDGLKLDFEELKKAHSMAVEALGSKASPSSEKLMDRTMIGNWLEAGCDPELDIIPVILARCKTLEDGSVRSFAMFGNDPIRYRDARLDGKRLTKSLDELFDEKTKKRGKKDGN